MKFPQSQIILTYTLLLALNWTVGCKQTEPVKARVPVNYFSMQVNGQLWTPYQDSTDPCNSTYSGNYSELQYASGVVIPFYLFLAYRDPGGQTGVDSDNYLRIQAMNVTKPGLYLLDGTYKENFDSYLTFNVKQVAGKSKRYVNNPNRRPFEINVEEITYRENASIPSIKGSFEGVAYNEIDVFDSLIIEKGKFNFKYMGNYHCGF